MYMIGVARGSASACYVVGRAGCSLASAVLLNRDGDDDDGGVEPLKYHESWAMRLGP